VAALLEEFFTEVVEQLLPLPPMLLRVMRIARILRILRLLKSFAGLRQVVMTLILSFPSFFNVTTLLALVIFMCMRPKQPETARHCVLIRMLYLLLVRSILAGKQTAYWASSSSICCPMATCCAATARSRR
jgi:hypothetical protein